ncbi:unnamed protein product [Rotaria socialis]|uniref:Uncharacterized protein n=2 Tax=Rotaria socialis TaxID=392032 RepID=A0A818ULA4_9BILA|nr:unnamed protein product [Rotaria socialis]
MAFIWNDKNNFILLHYVELHHHHHHHQHHQQQQQQQQSTISDINWSSIVNDINLEICSTSTLLKNQYEYLLEKFCTQQDSKFLHSTFKRNYLHSLCQKIEDDLQVTLETVYELIRHARTKRIHAEDIENLLTEWNFNFTSDDEKSNKDRLLHVLNRLLNYIHTFSNNDDRAIPHYLSTNSNMTKQSIVIQEGIHDQDLELISDNDDDISMTHASKTKQKQLLNIDNNQPLLTAIEPDKFSTARRRTKSLTVFDANKQYKVNIGVEWFVPKLKRRQRSSSFHGQYQSSVSIDSLLLQNRNVQRNDIRVTTTENDQSSYLINNSNLRQTHTQPSISWLPRTSAQISEKERQQNESKLIDNEQCEQMSSSDSESMKIQQSSDQQEQHSCKRQRLS